MSNKASLIRIKKDILTNVDLMKHIVNIFCITKNIKLSDTDVTVMSYFMVYGINNNTKNLIINSEICKNLNVIKGVMVKLRKLGFIYKDDLNGKNYVSDELKIPLNSTIGLYIQLNLV